MQNVEDIYPLSPLQQGMLFHSLYAPASGIYCEQMGIIFHEPFDSAAFKRAWQHVIDRHSILRTAFLWEELDEPLQVVQQHVPLPWAEQNWQDCSPSEQTTRLEDFLRADLERGFELARAPLLRLTLLRLSTDSCHFIWSYHHLLLDGWSIVLLLDEVFAMYEGLRQGTQPTLPPSRPYRDYIAWLQAQSSQAAEVFWRRYLSGFTTPTQLIHDPSLQASSATNLEQIDSQEFDGYLSETTTAALQRYIRQHQLTLTTVLQGAWALLLSRYSGETDVVFGHTISTRPASLEGVESMIGLFLNTLPVRVQFPPEGEVVQWLKHVQHEQIEAREYDYAPLAQVQQWSEAPAGKPLFESLLVIENYPRQSTSKSQEPRQKSSLSRSWSASERTNYPLTLSVGPRTALLLRISYDPARFCKQTIVRMVEHLRILLEHIISNPHACLRDLSYLTAEEHQQMLSAWNATTTAFPREDCLHTLFEAQVARTPESIALVHEDHHLTYAALNASANQAASALLKRGVGPEVCVGLCMERSAELFIGLLACLKAGGAYVPLDPNYPLERLRFILADAEIPVLLTSQDILDRVYLNTSDLLAPSSLGAIQVLCLDSASGQCASEPVSNLPGSAGPLNLAYVIYTSGSTGAPKGVLVPHQGVVNYSSDFQSRFGLGTTDRVLQLASISFDTALEEIFPTWYGGGTLVLAPERITAVLDFPDFTTFVEHNSLTVLDFPTSFWRAWIAQGFSTRVRLPHQLRLVIVGAEKVELDAYHAWLHLSPDHIIWSNTYGPTETTIAATTYVAPPGREEAIGSCVPIGRPVANVQVYVLDPQMQFVGASVPGELYI
nr:AMP-binding protein [Ktedonobacteraceae bacterium]